MTKRRQLLALIPLQAVIALIAIRTLQRSDPALHIVGWLLLAGVLFTLGGYLVAWRGMAKRSSD